MSREARKRQDEKHQRILKKMLEEEGNRYCADCQHRGPRWASWNLGVFICMRCAGIHRNLGVHISRVKSTTLDSWTPEQIQTFSSRGGNTAVNQVYEATLSQNAGRPKNDSNAERFIRDKYESKRFMQGGGGGNNLRSNMEPQGQQTRGDSRGRDYRDSRYQQESYGNRGDRSSSSGYNDGLGYTSARQSKEQQRKPLPSARQNRGSSHSQSNTRSRAHDDDFDDFVSAGYGGGDGARGQRPVHHHSGTRGFNIGSNNSNGNENNSNSRSGGNGGDIPRLSGPGSNIKESLRANGAVGNIFNSGGNGDESFQENNVYCDNDGDVGPNNNHNGNKDLFDLLGEGGCDKNGTTASSASSNAAKPQNSKQNILDLFGAPRPNQNHNLLQQGNLNNNQTGGGMVEMNNNAMGDGLNGIGSNTRGTGQQHVNQNNGGTINGGMGITPSTSMNLKQQQAFLRCQIMSHGSNNNSSQPQQQVKNNKNHDSLNQVMSGFNNMTFGDAKKSHSSMSASSSSSSSSNNSSSNSSSNGTGTNGNTQLIPTADLVMF